MPGVPGERRDFRQEVTNNVIAMLEKGVAPWQKPWEAGGSMPMNPTTERAYRGGNAIQLMATAMEKGYADPRWTTYKQAAKEGWQVKHGERGTQILSTDNRLTLGHQHFNLPQLPHYLFRCECLLRHFPAFLSVFQSLFDWQEFTGHIILDLCFS
jgi:hypothetical protein